VGPLGRPIHPGYRSVGRFGRMDVVGTQGYTHIERRLHRLWHKPIRLLSGQHMTFNHFNRRLHLYLAFTCGGN